MDAVQAHAFNGCVAKKGPQMPVRPFRLEVSAIYQESGREPSTAALALAEHIESVFAQGIHDLPGLVASLNAAGSRASSGKPWTDATLVVEMARWADAP